MVGRSGVPNYCQSVCLKQTTLEEDRELFLRFSSILCLWFEIQGRRTDNFFYWVLSTVFIMFFLWLTSSNLYMCSSAHASIWILAQNHWNERKNNIIVSVDGLETNDVSWRANSHKLPTIGSDNGLSPGHCRAIIWTNVGILLIGPLGTSFREILIRLQKFSFKKIHVHFVSASMC